jgi:hypothetical protein
MASTFTGLCADHDAEMFELADKHPLDTSNKEQLDQYASRAVMCELHTRVRDAALFWEFAAGNKRSGLNFDEPDVSVGFAAIHSVKAGR